MSNMILIVYCLLLFRKVLFKTVQLPLTWHKLKVSRQIVNLQTIEVTLRPGGTKCRDSLYKRLCRVLRVTATWAGRKWNCLLICIWNWRQLYGTVFFRFYFCGLPVIINESLLKFNLLVQCSLLFFISIWFSTLKLITLYSVIKFLIKV